MNLPAPIPARRTALLLATAALSTAAGLAGLAGVTASSAQADAASSETATTATATTSAPATSAVTWNGWRGVRFDDTVASAHDRLGGKFYRIGDTDGGCGDVLTTPTGSMNGNAYARPHRVGTISVKRSVDYPAGVNAAMSGTAIERTLRHAGYTVQSKRVTVSSEGDYDTWDVAVGPHGHTLWWATGDGTGHRPYRMGLSVNRHVATEQLGINGC